MRVTLVFNGKGGVGKSTTAHALATGLPRIDSGTYKTLAIDTDPQGNLSHSYGIADVKDCPTLFHVYAGDVSIGEAIQHTSQGDIIVGNASLTKVEPLLGGESYIRSIKKLREQLEQLPGDYTHVFMDNQPLVGGILTTQNLAAATDLLIPTFADVYSMQGLARLQEAYEDIKETFNRELRICGVLLTKYNPRTTVSQHLVKNITAWAGQLHTAVFPTFIRESVSVREAQVKKMSIFDYAPESNPAMDYMALLREYAVS